MTRKIDLKEYNAVIQICDCGKVDACKDDGHDCSVALIRRTDQESSKD